MKCVILAGGSGDRLWPLSRRSYPKQFVEIKENRSFLQETILRNLPFCDEFIIVTNAKYQFIVEGQLQAFQGLKVRCYFEEVSRGTAIPIILIAMQQNPSEFLLVTTADMAVGGSGYRDCILSAQESARRGFVSLVGLPITSPSTRYGYVKHNGELVERFVEKPEADEALAFFQSGEYVWNSGIFLTRSDGFLNVLEGCNRELFLQCQKVAAGMGREHNENFLTEELYRELPYLSVDRGVFERAEGLRVMKGRFSWRDVDCLEDVFPFTKRDERNTITRKCSNVEVMNRTGNQLVVANDLSDIMVVNTPDVVYVSGRGTSVEAMREIMVDNESQYNEYFDKGQLIYEPWGHYEVLIRENNFKVKKVTVYPGRSIPTHRHPHRSEHWSIVSGEARISLNGTWGDYETNDSVYVERGVAHRVCNDAETRLVIVEVGIGTTLGDGDQLLTMEENCETKNTRVEEIVRLEPAFKDYLWGGEQLKRLYHKRCDYDVIAESWELSAHPDGQSVIAEGRWKGMLFNDYLRRLGRDRLGWKAELYEEFPVLVKLIDASKPLSIQVHPYDDYAMSVEREYGKNEMWHIIQCDEGSYIYCGFRTDVTREQVLEAVEKQSLIQLLNRYEVREGDTIFIPAGTIHAIGEGILLCEVQQSSNSTYRIYDYGRRDKYGRTRELHLEKAMEVLDLSCWDNRNIRHEGGVKIDGGRKDVLVQCKYFETVKYVVEDEVGILLDETSFTSIQMLKGTARLQAGEAELAAAAGESFFLPAGRLTLRVKGRCQFLMTRL